VTLVIGLVRPLTAQRLLKDLTALGIRKCLFTVCDLTEKSYLSSHLWTKENWKRHLLYGAQQSSFTTVPGIELTRSLKEALERVRNCGPVTVLDNDPDRSDLRARKEDTGNGAVLVIGPERGWSDRERTLFLDYPCTITRLNDRILRTETAAVAGTVLLLRSLGFLTFP
jgi:RsmE family RNA methyltransferase